MKRSFFALLVVLMLVVSACAPAQAPAEEPAETPTETPVEEPMDESSQESDASSDSMEETGMYEDGIYYAEADEFSANSGWKSVVILKVTDGKISEVNWTAASKDGGMDKKAASMNGAYPMVEAGGAKHLGTSKLKKWKWLFWKCKTQVWENITMKDIQMLCLACPSM